MTDQTSIEGRVLKTLETIPQISLVTARFGLAVSGGGDSIAMLHLMVDVVGPRRLSVMCVNHGLRPEAAEEVALVEAQCAALGIAFETREWRYDGTGNLQAAARAGRWDVLRTWAEEQAFDAVLMGHTADDEVETFLMRFSRGSGVDGLSGMKVASMRDGVRIVRPLLQCGRAELRDWLTAREIVWADDPSNDDESYDRVKARKMLDHLAELGLTQKRVLQTVAHMSDAAAIVDRAMLGFAKDHVVQEQGDLVFTTAFENQADKALMQRVLVAGLQWVSGTAYKPRLESVRDSVASALNGQVVTLAGCVMIPEVGKLRLTRELRACEGGVSPHETGETSWDGRWLVAGLKGNVNVINAVGEAGLAQCPDWRDAGLPRKSAMATPAIWSDETLIAAPILGYGTGWSARIVADFADWLVTH